MFGKSLVSKLLTSFLLAFMLLPSLVSAEVKEIFAEGTYIMGDSETPSVAQERAIVEAKRAAIEQAGTYLESFTEVKNMQLTSDEIRVLASGLIETTVLDKKREVVDGEAFKVWVKVRCTVSTDNVQSMKNKIQDKQNVETLKKIQDDYAKAM